MIFEDLNANHIEPAARLALAEYWDECTAVPILPAGDYFQRLCELIGQLLEHKLGMVAIEDGEVVGFLTCYEPWQQHFGTTMGTFSPIHAHGVVKKERRRVYSRLYQAVAEKWVKQGILSHAIALYAHDREALASFFWNGFGLRCVDAIRGVDPIIGGDASGCVLRELTLEEAAERIVPLKNLLLEHLRKTPAFIPLYFTVDAEQMMEEYKERSSRYFVAELDVQTVAFIETTPAGENFACEDPSMMNICGAYMYPEFRGSGIYTKLLSYLINTLAKEGYTRCGVDFESFNPTASGFWLKYFIPYTHSVTRRIDERIYRPNL